MGAFQIIGLIAAILISLFLIRVAWLLIVFLYYRLVLRILGEIVLTISHAWTIGKENEK